MNYLLPNAQGIDAIFQQYQKRLYDLHLKAKLGLTDNNCLCFGRVNRVNVKGKTDKESSYVPIAYYAGDYVASSGNGNGNDLFFEAGKVVVFFDLIENKKNLKDYLAKSALMVFADMDIVTPNGINTNQQRLDEILLDGFESFTTFNGCGFTVTGTSFDIDKVLDRYSGTMKRKALTENMSDSSGIGKNFCALKLNLDLHYDPGAYQTNQ